ncbi:flavodoxin family protein [Saccharopolyspora karakumensis]|uniref:Flavodoxin family protein n=1 Tax=Saccharopolyspora karakumensis TaxID=2530386 RepID=A0A4R5C1D7_9PSEU|nr:NAD(P)H-dependent oxidoreductase [Saccharopolyspora karakumensis]TDD90522.1 flavodoxin family protein [Saccharopolyspora karakumensis]
MHTLVVVAHPDPDSLTQHVARKLVHAANSASAGHTAELGDLVAEGFDPRFTNQDRAAYLASANYPPDVVVEQTRIERAQHLVLVFPVWWWSMPALLKGWIDRVFSNGWAFGHAVGPDDADVEDSGGLEGLTIHLVPIASGNEAGYDRHGYDSALRTQLEHGLSDYCGARRGIAEYIWRSETTPADELRSRIEEIAGLLNAAVGERQTEADSSVLAER